MLSETNPLRKLAQNHPALLFITLTYVWSWSFWIPIHIENLPPGMKMALTFMGVFGPAVAGSLLLRLRENALSLKPVFGTAFFIGALLAVAAIIMFQLNLLGVIEMAPKDDITFPANSPWYVYGLMGLVVLTSGFVFSNVQHSAPTIRTFYRGLVPNRRTLVLAVPLLLFLPAILFGANLIATLAGLPYEQPEHLQAPASHWLPLMFVKLFTVFMLTGGNEEHGWRGVLLPILQERFSPLKATLIIALVWEPWHLPITLDFLEGNPNLVPVLIGRMIFILPIAFLMTFVYNASGGSIFLCVLLHACFNTQVRMFAGSELFLPMLMLTVIGLILFLKPWQRDRVYLPTRPLT